MSIQGYKSLIKGESSQIAFTDEATTTSDNLTYKISDAGKSVWAYGVDIEVKDGGVVTTEDYVISRLDGSIAFSSAATRDITVSGSYVVLSEVAECKEFSFDGTTDMLETTIFQNAERTYVPGLIGATLTLSRFYNVDNYFTNYLYAGATVVVEIYPDSSGEPFRVYGIVSNDSVASTVEGLLEESITLQITNKMILEA